METEAEKRRKEKRRRKKMRRERKEEKRKETKKNESMKDGRRVENLEWERGGSKVRGRSKEAGFRKIP